MAQRRLADWLADGTLVTDDRPSFTVYRMVATDDAGVERRTTGVIGALELSPPGTDILPHEHTTPKAKSDRLDLLRSCRANLSAIWKSEERRVGKECVSTCRSRWSPYHYKKK